MKFQIWERKTISFSGTFLILLSILACFSEPEDDLNNSQLPAANAGGDDGENTLPPPGTSCDNPILLTQEEHGTGGTLEEGCYIVYDDISLSALLTIKPGVTIQFYNNVGLEIENNGQLVAIGNEQKPIVFTGIEPTRGHWKGLRFIRSRFRENILKYVILEYAGASGLYADDGGIVIHDSQVDLTIKDSIIRANKTAGIHIDHRDLKLTIASSLFEDNEVAIRTTPNMVKSLSEDIQFKDNDAPYIIVHDGYYYPADRGSAPITTTQTWPTFSLPYRIDTTIQVLTDWTLSPGTTLEFNPRTSIEVKAQGTLTADASTGDRIRFMPPPGETTRGAWEGIKFHESKSSKNTFKNVDILYAGGSEWPGFDASQAAISLSGSTASLSNVKIAGSAKYGIRTWSEFESTVEPCDNVIFQNNADDNLSGDGLGACL